ncbi:LLM class flavin-dependent oxidoreductase, partial [Microvirga sp. 3-52]|nr:LLM class flavin-dependent oxidoreductase [Microvirga sp. 3-52]
TIVESCDAHVMHGGTVEEVQAKVDDMKKLRSDAVKEPFSSFGLAAYVVCRDTEEEVQEELAKITSIKETSGYAGYKDFTGNSELEQQVKLYDYSVSNRGLRPNLIGTPEQIAGRILEFEKVGVDLLLIYCSCNFLLNLKKWNVFREMLCL